jgi:hypothetical protein
VRLMVQNRQKGESKFRQKGPLVHHCPVSELHTLGQEPNAKSQFESPLSENLDANHDDAPLRFRKMAYIVGLGSPPGQAIRNVLEFLMFAVGGGGGANHLHSSKERGFMETSNVGRDHFHRGESYLEAYGPTTSPQTNWAEMSL